MGLSKITRNYQVTLPKDVRELRHLEVGDKVLFVMEGDRIDVVKADRSVIRDAAGLWAGTKETGAQYQQRVRMAWKKRAA